MQNQIDDDLAANHFWDNKFKDWKQYEDELRSDQKNTGVFLHEGNVDWLKSEGHVDLAGVQASGRSKHSSGRIDAQVGHVEGTAAFNKLGAEAAFVKHNETGMLGTDRGGVGGAWGFSLLDASADLGYDKKKHKLGFELGGELASLKASLSFRFWGHDLGLEGRVRAGVKFGASAGKETGGDFTFFGLSAVFDQHTKEVMKKQVYGPKED